MPVLNKIFQWIKKWGSRFLESKYYLNKIIQFILHKDLTLIGYSKKHPIYTSNFEENPAEGYLYFYFNPGTGGNILTGYLHRRTRLYHLDAASSSNFRKENKNLVIECEGRPYEWFFKDSRVKRILVESKWSGQEYIGQGRVTLVYPAINKNFHLTKKRNNFNTDKPITLCSVGYGGLLKGFDIVVRSYLDLKDDYNLKLIIAGSFGHNFTYYPEITRESYERADFGNLEKLLRKDENVLFRPIKRKDLFTQVYPVADIYLHLSRLETFGYSILEAMSFGLPVIASDLHAIPEMVEDGYNGYLVGRFDYDVNSLDWYDCALEQTKASLIKLITGPSLREEFGNNSIKMIDRKFSMERKNKILAECYESILA